MERAEVELADALRVLVADLEGARLEDHEVVILAGDEVLDVERVARVDVHAPRAPAIAEVAVQGAQRARELEDRGPLQKERGLGLLLITHDLGVVAGIADRVVVMYAGEVVETGTSAQVLESPRHPYAEGLMRSIPARGKAGHREPLGYIAGTVPRPIAERAGCGFAPRCPYAHAACAVDAVALRAATADRTVRCILPVDGSGRDPDVWTRAGAAAAGVST